ncbi:MAG: polyamine aminopropyltransferase [Rhodothermus sp.]|nr:polyamine aminopropyltransferase [Rhodothermus sp.]
MAAPKQHQLQYTEFWQERTGLTFGVERILFNRQSAYQHVQVLQTDAFGRVLTLDGLVMLTERDEFVYHEMIAHPALCLLPRPRRVLIVGGGDGGTLREVLRYAEIEQVDLVEIDEVVIEAARTCFPELSVAFEDPRARLHVADGVAFVQGAADAWYDLIIVDSTDPVNFAEGLFGESFYRDCARILTDEGILVTQSESPFDHTFQASIQAAHAMLGRMFAQVHMYLAHIPTYPMGLWSFTLASKRLHPVVDFDPEQAARRLASFADRLRYYNVELHRAAFALPSFVRRLFADGGPPAHSTSLHRDDMG